MPRKIAKMYKYAFKIRNGHYWLPVTTKKFAKEAAQKTGGTWKKRKIRR